MMGAHMGARPETAMHNNITHIIHTHTHVLHIQPPTPPLRATPLELNPSSGNTHTYTRNPPVLFLPHLQTDREAEAHQIEA